MMKPDMFRLISEEGFDNVLIAKGEASFGMIRENLDGKIWEVGETKEPIIDKPEVFDWIAKNKKIPDQNYFNWCRTDPQSLEIDTR